MASMTIHNLDDDLKQRLRLRAARHGQSMEEEARSILRCSLQAEPLSGQSLVDSIREMAAPYGDIDLQTSVRGPMGEREQQHTSCVTEGSCRCCCEAAGI